MSAFTIATITVYSSIGLVALTIGLLARRHTTLPFAIGAAGLLLLTAASTWLVRAWPAPEIAELRRETDRLQRENAALSEEGRRQRDQQRATALVAQSADADLVSVRADLMNTHAELQKAREETRTANDGADRLSGELQAEAHKREDAESQGQAARARVAELERQVVDLSLQVKALEAKLSVILPSPTPPPRAALVDPVQLRELIGKRIVTPCYSIEPLEPRELVDGLPGSWYLIRFRITDAPLIFPDRQFRLPDTDAVVESARTLVSDFLGPVARTARKHRIFVRGGADPRPVTKTTDEPDTAQLWVLPQLPRGTYAAKPEMRRVAKAVRNEDLPGLRADWLRRQLSRILPLGNSVGTVDILDDAPGPGRERTAELVLFVDW